MGKTVALQGPSARFAQETFARYYRTAKIEPPPSLPRREFACMPFEGAGMRRHIALPTEESLGQMLSREVPRHAYYSSAYYKDPGHPIMVSKGWGGADVIFDLDADHLRQAEGKSYSEQLALAKERFLLLVDEFLTRDFGIGEGERTLVFSGGRGYHAHIHREEFRRLASAERRELVAYLSPEGANLRRFLFPAEHARAGPPATPERTSAGVEGGPERTKARRGSGRLLSETYPRLPPPEAPGWAGRLTRTLFRLFDEWTEKGWTAQQVADELLRLAVLYHVESFGPELARSVARQLVDGHKMEKARTTRVLELGEGKGRGSPRALVDLIEALAAISLGETDAPVTTDIHRLIRLPGSLHGGTGLRVRRLTREELEEFDPLRDALLPDDPSRPSVKVQLVVDVDHPFGGERLHGKEGDVLDLRDPAALFLVLRGEGTVVAPPGT